MTYATALIIACIGAWTGFANPVFQAPYLSLLFPAGIALAGFSATTPAGAFRRGLFAGTLAYGGCLYWVALPVHDYGNLPWLLAAPCPVLLGLYCGLYAGLFALGMRMVRYRLPWLLTGVFAACLWAALEALRGWLFTGFPWLCLASAFAPIPWMLQAAALVGANGLSGALAGAAVLPLAGQGKARAIVASLAALALVGGYGMYAVGSATAPTETVRVALVQGNIDQAQKWDMTFQDGTVDRYETLTQAAQAQERPNLVVWPETALPFYFQETSLLGSRVRKLAREGNSYLLTGAPAYTPAPDGSGYRMHNRAFLIGPDGATAGFYDKEHLVPFGEYVPFGNLLFFLDKLVQGVGDFVPGTSTVPLPAGTMDLGVLICYETIFPELAQARVDAGANLLVNISNDAWFGDSSAPLQHLHMSVLRAVEQGRWLVRGTNTGISAIIDPLGEIRAQGGLFRAESVSFGEVGIVSTLTPYHRHRDALRAGCAVLLLLFGLAAHLSPFYRRVQVLD
ncbi:apolipoprotein N-acyltransferase [Desulfobaculum xiamenense]|uniref:Apolipoprotein N-acyltransferase n=1 Tax=Desulfobaculum xiamenense TaxID=995050 RepID=A0A846QI63_9BACT|nr:apolipoprotein N-acyltransferase [Desulfobaculum xiamenense]NJB66737.1 apolipoprotein N-acyltransferase [Desulfobaculum xiamenense]